MKLSHPARVAVARLLQIAAALCISTHAMALSVTPPPDWRPPVITVSTGSQPIELKAVSIEVDVFGSQARTSFELRLHNPNGRVLEGELQFPLQQGQVVTGFALDVNGRLRDAVPVPKARGQEIFEDIRRRRVDPGLLEATAGNQYKLRVYPIPALGERRVVISVTETLPRRQDRSLLRVPLVFASSVGQLDLNIRIHGAAQGDIERLQAPAGLEVSAGPDMTTVTLKKQRWQGPQGSAGWLQLALRQNDRPQVMVGESAGKTFFAAQRDIRDEAVRRPSPRHIALVWDASASAATQVRVLPVLEAYFRQLNQPVKVSLLLVRNRTEALREFTVAPGRFAELAQVLQAEPRDGASNFDDLPVPETADLTIMVTDGLTTDGRRTIDYRHKAPVLVLNGAAAADTARLTRLADRTGGAFIDATTASVEEGARAMAWHGWRIEGVSSLGAQQLAAPSLQLRQGRIAVAGELLDRQARINFVLAHPDGRRRTVALRVDAATQTAGHWPGQQWAQWRSAELAEDPAGHQRELEQIAAAHGIAGPNSSLIVLEMASDYARYQLPAPPDLASEVARLGQQQVVQADQKRRSHLESMVQQFEARQRWWEKDFPKDAAPVPPPAKPASTTAAIGGSLSESSLRQRAAPAPAAAAPMALAPAAPAAPATSAATAAMADRSNEARKQTTGTAAQTGVISLQAWVADAPYMKRLQKADASGLYGVYLDERAGYASSSSFYMDAAGVFFERGQPELGLRVLSNLAEMNLENRQLLRLYAYRLTQAGRADLAIAVFERITVLAPNEPQSWRDLGLAHADNNQPQRAVDALWEVVSQPWNGRFSGINMIALAELNAIAAQPATAGQAPLDLDKVDTRLRGNLPLALRVVMAWDSDDTDIDLWVTDPNGEKASYQNRLTRQGGAMSPDATGGYGPEEFSLKTAKAGSYGITAQFFGERQQVLSGGTTVMVRITTGFGTPQAKNRWTTLRLTNGKETVQVAKVQMN